MKTGKACSSSRRGFAAIASAVALASAAWTLQAQTVKINFRPLTPQEIKDYGLTNTTQKSGGAPNTGIGQPVYLEALVQTGTTVLAVNWSLVGLPPGSLLNTNLPASPLSNQVPTYDGGDRIGLFVAGRAVLRPDQVSGFDFANSVIQDYKIRTDVVLSN